MAVNRITNKQVVNKESVSRVEQISTKNTTIRGNREITINPGNNFSDNYSITLKDVDTSIINHIKNIMKPTIKEANETIKIPVYYGNEERWKSVRERGVLRDRNGSLILPLIILKRVEVSRNELSGQSYSHDVQNKHVSVVRNSSWSKENQYDRFSVLQGVKPANQNIVTTMPTYSDVTYEFILWTNYIEQMNPIIESFVDHSHTYWGGATDLKFLSVIENISDASEMSEAGERFIKSTFNVLTKAYLLPEYLNSVVTNKISNMRKELVPSQVVFGIEGDASDYQVKPDLKTK